MINIKGTGEITKIKKSRNKNGNIFSIKLSANDTVIMIERFEKFRTTEYKKLTSLLYEGNRISFSGILNEDGIVETNKIFQSYLESSGFSFESSNEEIYDYSSNGLVLRLGVKAPSFSFKYKTFDFLVKANNENVFDRLIGVIKDKKVSLSGSFKNGIAYLSVLKGATS